MANYWCVNFDASDDTRIDPEDHVLRHGLMEDLWLMQYQYSHGGHEYQGGRHQKATTTKSWKALWGVSLGDWFVAYMSGSRFYAIGKVIEPRQRKWQLRERRHEDTIARTVDEKTHQFLEGIIRYTDASLFYEDFTDPWRLRRSSPPVWKYPQRVDVEKWELIVPSGVQVPGLAEAAPFPRYRNVIFTIPESFFQEIRTALQHCFATT